MIHSLAYSEREQLNKAKQVMINSIDNQVTMIIDRLNNAINVCYEAPENEDQGYAFATGYARSAMTEAANSLSDIVKQLRDEV